jgi:uncharacterized protein YceH (UPF0502 family)
MTRQEAELTTRNVRAYHVRVVQAWKQHLTRRFHRSDNELVPLIARKSGLSEHLTEAILVIYPEG